MQAAAHNAKFGLIDNWLRHVQDVQQKHRERLLGLGDENERVDRLCELNVIEQVVNVARTTIVRDGWSRGQPLSVHGWIYRLQNGLLHDLGMCVSDLKELDACYESAVDGIVSLPNS